MKLFIITLFLVLASFCQAEYSYQLAVCAIFQDEAPYLKEWIEYNRLMGVEHFYLYNHRSGDNFQEVLQPYIRSGLVDLNHVTQSADSLMAFNPLQCECYTECLKKSRGICKWLAFIDIDEYFLPMNEPTVPAILKKYEMFGGLGVNWRVFGPSHVWKIPPGQLLIEALTCCSAKNFPPNVYVKTIVRPERASHFTNPHLPIFYPDYFAVNTDRMPLKEEMESDYVQTNQLRINHYWAGDGHNFYNKKLSRLKKWGGNCGTNDAAEYVVPKINAERDELILRFAPALRRAMGNSMSFKR